MDIDPVILWNVILTIVVGPIVYWGIAMATYEADNVEDTLKSTYRDIKDNIPRFVNRASVVVGQLNSLISGTNDPEKIAEIQAKKDKLQAELNALF